MNTIQIDNVLCKHVKYFQVVYPIDLLPSTLIKPSIIVFNLDKLYMSRSHWIAVCISDSGYAEYFDSYVLLHYKFEIKAFLQHHSISWTFKRYRLQGVTSNVCGHYCRITSPTEAGDNPWRHSWTFLYLLASPATIKKQCACSALSLKSAPLAASWRRSSSRASRRHK